jgi:GntR family transcriptional regulator
VASDLGVNLNTIAFAYRSLQQDGLIKVKHGSGAVVTSRLLTNKTEELLRVHLRTALTNMTLAGFNPAEIKSFVNEDLKKLSEPGLAT